MSLTNVATESNMSELRLLADPVLLAKRIAELDTATKSAEEAEAKASARIAAVGPAENIPALLAGAERKLRDAEDQAAKVLADAKRWADAAISEANQRAQQIVTDAEAKQSAADAAMAAADAALKKSGADAAAMTADLEERAAAQTAAEERLAVVQAAAESALADRNEAAAKFNNLMAKIKAVASQG